VINDNNTDKELRNRIILANKWCHELEEKFRSPFLTLSTKSRFSETLLRPVLIYGNESWALTKGNEENLLGDSIDTIKRNGNFN
jgi:hypothetical protein